jgi:hypothetical protein
MNSFWTSAANEVANVWHGVQSNPFHAFCMTAITILGVGGITMRIKEKIAEDRRSKEYKERLDRIPDPPEFDPQKFTASDRSPR